MTLFSRPANPIRKQSHTDIIQHMERHYGPVQEHALVEIVPTLDIAINVIPARPQQNPLILFTTGMSDRPQTVPPGADEYRYTELFIRLPDDWPMSKRAMLDPNFFWPFQWLRQIAFYPHENDTWLGGPYPIIANDEPPQPLAPNTRLSCLLLIREDGEAGTVLCQDGRQIALYSFLPLYTEERDMEIAQGIVPLFKALEAGEVSFVVDPSRASAAIGQ